MYSPKIKEEFVRRLYQLKLIEKTTITALANEAIAVYLNNKTLSDNISDKKEVKQCRK